MRRQIFYFISRQTRVLAMSDYRALQAETVKFRGYNGDQGEAYYARPIAAGISRRGFTISSPAVDGSSTPVNE